MQYVRWFLVMKFRYKIQETINFLKLSTSERASGSLMELRTLTNDSALKEKISEIYVLIQKKNFKKAIRRLSNL